MADDMNFRSFLSFSRFSRQSSATTIRQSQRGDNASTCSSLESLANSEAKNLWAELQTKDKIIAQLRSTVAELEPVAINARAQVQRLDTINVRHTISF